MSNSLGGWRLLVHLFLPIPLVLTLLLVVPLPRNVRKGILIFTHRALAFPVLGGLPLVNFALFASGVPFVDSVVRTYKSNQALMEVDLRPELKISVLAKKWREERNFWIAAMGFTLWCLLSTLYAQVSHAVALEEEVEELREEVADLKGEPRPAKSGVKSKMAGAVAPLLKGGPGRAARTPATDAPSGPRGVTDAAAGGAADATPLTHRRTAAATATTAM